MDLAWRAQKVQKYDPKINFIGFWQKSYPFRYAFLLQHDSANGLLTFCKNNLGYGPKTS